MLRIIILFAVFCVLSFVVMDGLMIIAYKCAEDAYGRNLYLAWGASIFILVVNILLVRGICKHLPDRNPLHRNKLIQKLLCLFGLHVENFTDRPQKSCYYCGKRLTPFLTLGEKEFNLLVSGLPCVVDGTHIILKDIGFDRMRELIDTSEKNPDLYIGQDEN